MPNSKSLFVEIRPETPIDLSAVTDINTRAFGRSGEARLVENIRAGEHYIPDLSLVAVQDGDVVGHILFSVVHIRGDDGSYHESLALAPMAVDPDCQRQGIGGRLVAAGLESARAQGYGAVIVLGHPEYYPKFGFRPASLWNIRPPFSVPDEAFMAIELHEQALGGKAGTVVYPDEFRGV